MTNNPHPRVTIGGAEVAVKEAGGLKPQSLSTPTELKVMVEAVPDHTIYQVDDSQQRFNTGVAISGLSLLTIAFVALLVWLLVRIIHARRRS